MQMCSMWLRLQRTIKKEPIGSFVLCKGESREREENLLSFIFLTKIYDYTRSSFIFTLTSSSSGGNLYLSTCLLNTLLGFLYLVKSISGWSFINALMS